MHKIGFLCSEKPLDGERAVLAEKGITDVELYDVPCDEHRVPLPDSLRGTEGLVVEWGSVPAWVFKENPQLKCVADMSIGYDNIDVDAATESGAFVTNVPGYCTYDVALHALSLICDLYRKVSYRDRLVRSGRWDDMAGYPVWRPRGKTAGLVYFGSIARALVPMLHGIGMNVAVYAPTKKREFIEEYGCKKVDSVDDLFAMSDVVSLHCPLVGETEGLVNARTLALMKPTAFLVNTARGGCVDEEALAEALKNGTIAAAALDVIRDEARCRSPLIGLENVVITPHAAYLSEDSYAELRSRAFLNCLSGVLGETPIDRVNGPLEWV